MTKKQMEALKPGDIVVEKETGDQFKFLHLVSISDMVQNGSKFDFVNARKELAVGLIPGFEYARRRVTSGPYFVFSHKKMAVKEDV